VTSEMTEKLIEYITVPRSEYDRLHRAGRQYEARYEALAAEMRRVIEQAHSQLNVGVKDMNTAIARIKELEARVEELEAERLEGKEVANE